MTQEGYRMDPQIEEAFMGMLDLARGLSEGSKEFMPWFRARTELAALAGFPAAGYLTPVNVFEHLLGVDRRSYRYWEAAMPDYPVKDPPRAYQSHNAPRVYTHQNAVDIALWHWRRVVQEPQKRIRYYSALDVAGILRTDEASVVEAMRKGDLPGDHATKRVSQDDFSSWLSARVKL